MSNGDDGSLDDFGPPPELPDGLKKEVIRKADACHYRRPRNGDVLTVHYVGTFESDGSEFDSSRARGDPIQFTLGEGKVIRGWELAFPTMRKGELAKITLQPEFAYGDAGQPPKIPEKAVLIFEVELLSWISKDDLFGDEGCIKSQLEEGSGWKHPKKGDEVRMTMRVKAQGGTVLDERTEVDYFLGSGDLGLLTKCVDKALSGMTIGEKCSLRIEKGYVYENGEHGVVTLDLTMLEIYEIADVSLLQNRSVLKKRLKEGESCRPGDGCKVTLRVESVTDGVNPLPGFSGPQTLKLTCGGTGACDPLMGAVAEMNAGERVVLTCTQPSKCVDANLGLSEITAEKVCFTVELVDCESEKDMWKMSNEGKVTLARAKKDEGAALFKVKRFELALKKYEKVIHLLQDTSKYSEELKLEAAELKKASDSNKGACYLQLGDHTSALSICNGILADDHNNVKVLFRRAKCHYGRSEHVDAIRDLDRVMELDPSNSEAKTLQTQVKRAQKVADKGSKSTFAKMCQGFGKEGFGFEHKKPEPKPEPKKEEPEEPPRPRDLTDVIFQLQQKVLPVEKVFVTGAPEALGAWDPAKAIPLKRVAAKLDDRDLRAIQDGKPPPERHLWESQMVLSENEGRTEYKYLIRGPSGDRLEGQVHVVQLGGSGGSRMRCQDTWRS